jgi:hypothetical protein
LKALKIKYTSTNRGWNGPVSLSQRISKTCRNKGYSKVQINGGIYSLHITNEFRIGHGITWLKEKIGFIDCEGSFKSIAPIKVKSWEI